ncbi:MAG TPA: S41 family peptidase [Flavobacterium sp.]|uniref:S41 family peptidase n=1 Tax=Flavobacterium sp. TaxID=239 RepID=UPI002CABD187|nr:S41 family peptidase [Flavobacterium sp.]HSD13718.1 S41 family peptidase [Flavobacterium sp.]
MRIFITLGLLLVTVNLFGQNCDCLSELSHVITYFENNNPAFQKIKNNPKDYMKYRQESEKLKTATKLEKDSDRCIVYLDRYVSLLKDHHSDIGFQMTRTDLSTPELIAKFKSSKNYLQFEKASIDTVQLIPLLRAKKTSDIEGIYSDGGKIVFGIIKKEHTLNQYQGVVLKKNKLLEVGHVLLELTQTESQMFDVNYNVGLLGFNFNRIFKNLKIENGQITNFGFSKIHSGSASNEKEYEFKTVNDSVNYLRLSSFDHKLTDQLDSFYNDIDKLIQAKPYLIIDLRNNGGGSEKSYLNLLPYAYTRPLKIDATSVWVSPDNIKRYEEIASDGNTELIERMKKAKPFTFIPYSEKGSDTWTLETSTTYPKKIALLFDRGTASAAEGMILYFLQSDKVITIGDNSGGYIGYGNVMPGQTPCGKYTIRSTTTKYEEKSKYEFVGIEPMHKVAKEKDWISYAMSLFSKN